MEMVYVYRGSGGSIELWRIENSVEDLSTGQTKRISVGKKLNDLTVKSISLDDGVLFVDPNGQTQTLNISSGK